MDSGCKESLYLEEALAALAGAHAVVLAGGVVSTHCAGTLPRRAPGGGRGKAVPQQGGAGPQGQGAEGQAAPAAAPAVQLVHVLLQGRPVGVGQRGGRGGRGGRSADQPHSAQVLIAPATVGRRVLVVVGEAGGFDVGRVQA